VIGLHACPGPRSSRTRLPCSRARVSAAQVESGLTFGAYLDRIEQSRQPYDRTELARRGAYVEFEFVVRGYKGQAPAAALAARRLPSGVQLAHSRDLRVKPRVDRDAGSWNIWVPLPRRRHRLYVQVQLYNDAGTVPIGRVCTARFTGYCATRRHRRLCRARWPHAPAAG
jgi:hypothetical protein